MNLEKQKKRFYFFVIIILFILSFNIFTLNIFFGQNSTIIAKNPLNTIEIQKQGNIHASTVIPHEDIEWLKNSNFSTTEYWVSNIAGDSRDIDANIRDGQANYYVLGDQGTFSNVSGTPTSGIWKNVTNTNFPSLPTFHEIDGDGCHVYHTWQDPTNPFQMTSIHWDRNITLPVDMSDYNITSASLAALVNATVTPFGTTLLYRGGVDVEGDTIDESSPDFSREYDYVRFYVLISDLQKDYVFEIAYNQTKNLGQDSGPTISNMTDTEMFTYPEETIISHLSTVLEKDPDHKSFTLTLGLRIYCADNGMGDNDTWNSLRIKSCNFSFTYEKIINQFSSVAWEQESNEISGSINGSNIQITGAILNFDYIINQTWPMSISPNSEIRIVINDKQHTETLKLSNAPLIFQEAKIGGFDVSTLISPYINISLSIQVFLGDEFGLDQEFKISVDNVSLKISYIEIYSDILSEPLIFRVLLIVALVASLILGTYLVLYQKILKYPKPVRKVRKYKRTLRRKQAPRTPISSREGAFTASFNKELSKTTRLIKGKPTEQKSKLTKKLSTVNKNPSSNKVNKTSEKLDSIDSTNIYKPHFNQKVRKISEKIRSGKYIFKKLKLHKYQKFLILIIILLISLLNPFILRTVKVQNYGEFQNSELNFKEMQNRESLYLSTVVPVSDQWLLNSEFDTSEHWNLLKGDTGDKTDVDGNINQGQANYEVLGEIRTFSNISGTPDDIEWTRVVNLNFPDLPDTAQIIEGYGCYVSHEWAEKADQSPSVHWDRNVTMPVNMSDYIITSVSLNTVVNATVEANGGVSGGIEVPGDFVTDYATHDYVRFYVLFSDLSKEKVYEVAFNQTRNLGNDLIGSWDYMLDTNLTNVYQDKLIEYLTSVLRTDDRHFTITLGIRIWCEDNFNWDEDNWEALWIKSCNLTFTYERKINRFTAISWNQVGDDISGDNIQITGANLEFKYKVDQLWPALSSPNSEIRVLINDNPHTETIKLSSATLTFQEAKEGGYDVTTLISKDVNISLSIQILLADEFSLDQNIIISIDEVYLKISYTVFIRDIFSEPWVFTLLLVLASVIAAGVGGYLIAYQRFLKYPRPVRKVRKFKRTLRKTKEPEVIIMSREIAFKKSYNRELAETSKSLKLKPGEPELPKIIEKAEVPAKSIETKIDSEELITKSLEKKEELDDLVQKLPEKPDS